MYADKALDFKVASDGAPGDLKIDYATLTRGNGQSNILYQDTAPPSLICIRVSASASNSVIVILSAFAFVN